MSCDQFLQSCYNNCTDNTAFKDACDTCPPDTCSNFLKLCDGNCTDDSAFEDACMESCPTPASSYILLGLLILGILYCLWKNGFFKCDCPGDNGSYGRGQGRNPVVVQAQPVLPVVQGRLIPKELKVGDTYPKDRLSTTDIISINVLKYNPVHTESGYVIDAQTLKVIKPKLRVGDIYPEDRFSDIDFKRFQRKKTDGYGDTYSTFDNYKISWDRTVVKVPTQQRSSALNQPMMF